MGNPYSMVFGKKPGELISRNMQTDIVYDAFKADQPSQQVFVITGVRGSGKTVFMTDVSKKIAENEDFIVVELNPERDMLKSLASKLIARYRCRLYKTMI